MRRILAAALSAGISVATAATQVDLAERWNLADVYPSEQAWHDDAARLGKQISEFGSCQGHLGDSAARLRSCLDLRADIAKRAARLHLFAGEQLAEDTGSPASMQLRQQSELLGDRVRLATAFVGPELLAIGAERIGKLVAEDQGLRIHAFPLERIIRRASHTLDGAGEELVAQFGNISDTGESIYRVLSNADMPWPKVKLSSGEEIVLDQSAYTRVREAPNRADRKLVMDSFFGTFKQFERSLGVMFYSQLKQDAVYSKVRKYPDSITRVLDGNRIPVAVVDTLIAQTEKNLPTLWRYFRLRARLLGVKDMAYYDIYPPLVSGQYRFPIERGRQLALDAVAPLGAEYSSAMAVGLASRWMDTYPRPRKQSGAHMAGYAYDVHPYVLMNYNDDYESVSTLAHEWGHAMHSYLANRAQPYVTAGYATFVAEIASTFNEELLLDRMLKTASSDDERIFYLGHALESLRGTFFRQAMFAEFERRIHAAVDAGKSLTGEQLSQQYCALLKRYHGVAEGVMTIDERYCVEWAYIPHFYSPFYVYQYATAIAASSLFADQVVQGEPGARERYLGLLRAGGSADPYDLVKAAGVDLASPAPYQSLVARMNRVMDEIEAILARKG